MRTVLKKLKLCSKSNYTLHDICSCVSQVLILRQAINVDKTNTETARTLGDKIFLSKKINSKISRAISKKSNIHIIFSSICS